MFLFDFIERIEAVVFCEVFAHVTLTVFYERQPVHFEERYTSTTSKRTGLQGKLQRKICTCVR